MTIYNSFICIIFNIFIFEEKEKYKFGLNFKIKFFFEWYSKTKLMNLIRIESDILIVKY